MVTALPDITVEPTITGDGAITIAAGLVTLTKGSAAEINPPVAATSLIKDGATGGAKTTCTFAAFVGATLKLAASQFKWNVVSKNVVTIT